MRQMTFQVHGLSGRFDVSRLVIAGWTGRDGDAVEHHIAELAAIGVRRPRTIPCFYTVMFCGTLAVQGEISGGERFEIELIDPLRRCSLTHEYTIRALPVAD